MITESEIDLYRDRVSRGFGQDGDSGEASRERFNAIFELDRTLAAFDGDDIIGTCAGFSLGVTVPGGAEVPMGGTTVITTQPTHRRQGVLRAMMERHLGDVEDHREPLAGLWASEGSIYGRFGYAPATYRHIAAIDARAIDISGPAPAGQAVRFLEATEAELVVRSLYEAVRPERSGMLTRGDGWWTHRILADPEEWRKGKSSLRYVVVEEDGVPVGYAAYRQKEEWEDFTARGTIHVSEIITTTAKALHALWRFLTNIDLFPSVEYWNLPVDDALPAIVTDQRRARRTLADSLWVRVMDVKTALELRAYEEPGEVVFSVTDDSRPDNSGVYRLVVDGGHADCIRSVSESPQLVFDVDVLGHLYLGGGNALTMADAGRVQGDPEAVWTLHRLFRTAVAPWCPDVF